MFIDYLHICDSYLHILDMFFDMVLLLTLLCILLCLFQCLVFCFSDKLYKEIRDLQFGVVMQVGLPPLLTTLSPTPLVPFAQASTM